MRKSIIVLSLVLLSLSLGNGNASASSYQTVENSSPQDVVDSMAAKGVRGAANLLTGWVELPKQIYLTGAKDGWLRGSVIGPLKGIGMTVVRTVSGAGELMTFFVPYPGFYDPWFEPRFVWQKE
jgi:putative exosortase-associated protein (TIGR04073 family)